MITSRFGGEAFAYCETCLVEEKENLRLDNLEELKNEEREAERRRVMRSLHALDIGRRFRGKTFDQYQAVLPGQVKAKDACSKFAETFKDRLEGGDSMILYGKPGTGKNHLAAAICEHVIKSGFIAVHTTAIKLVREIKTTWARGAERSEKKVVESFITPDLLVIDEIGAQYGSTAEQILIMDVINGRYAEMRPTIMLTNLGINELEEILGRQVVDRFYEGKSQIIPMAWESHRRKA